jgi:transposase-like protein
MTILYRLTNREALRELKEDLRAIKDIGIEIESVTCDGAANIIRAVKEVCPEAVIQRCTFHISNEICIWLTKKPKSEAARELRTIAMALSSVKTNIDAQMWLKDFIDWENKHHEYINEKSFDEESGRWWYTHKMLHRSFTHIKRAIPYMFNYTLYSKIPKTSNSIESFFGHLKDHLRLHRGLSESHFKDFVKWYLFLQSNEGKTLKKW